MATWNAASLMKLTKSDRRSCLSEDRLDSIRIEGPPLEQWDSENAVQLWWGDKIRRVNRSEPSTSTGVSRGQLAEQPIWTLDEWDNWLEADSTL